MLPLSLENREIFWAGLRDGDFASVLAGRANGKH